MNKTIGRQIKTAKKRLSGLNSKIGGAGRGIAAAAAGAALFVANLGKSLYNSATEVKDQAFGNKHKSKEAVSMKKSTVIALMVALAAVAGVLGALYFYVLRREKELDEYEQLLFSEDFNDDLMDDAADEAGEAKA